MKKCLVTIDTEGISGENALERNIWGGPDRVGIDKIMDILDANDVKGLFFVDMAGGYAYGKDKLKEILVHIEERGHITGVHIHPMHMADINHDFLWQYSPEEQKNIIDKCTKDFEEMTGHPPLYFRAGKYSVDDTTIELLQKHSYRYEFSSFSSRNWCHLSNPKSKNVPYNLGKLIEIPVTVFQIAKFGKFRRFEKIDIATMSVPEFKHILKQIAKQTYDYPFILFLHSFSFLDRSNPEQPKVDYAAMDRFDGMLKAVKENGSFEFWNIEKEDFSMPQYEQWMYQDYPSVQGKFRQFRYLLLVAWRIRKTNRNAKLLLGGVISFALLLLVLITALICVII